MASCRNTFLAVLCSLNPRRQTLNPRRQTLDKMHEQTVGTKLRNIVVQNLFIVLSSSSYFKSNAAPVS